MAIILVVEDDLLIRELIEMTLQGWGHDVVLASDTEEALEVLRSNQPLDMLFTDLSLKSAMNGGLDVAQQALVLRATLGVLYATGNAMTREMRARFVEGADCLTKPYTERQLRHSIDRVLAA